MSGMSHRVASWVTASVAHSRWRTIAPAILLTSVATGLAWFLAHDVLGHPQPFFAPIAAAVCLSASNVLRGQRAIQMIIGVALGIGVGVGARDLLGSGPVAIGLAALVSLGVAVLLGRGFIAQGLMFYNQTAASAILILTTQLTATGTERLIDALIGGGLALVSSVLLFPAAPLPLLRDAEHSVLAALRDILRRIARPPQPAERDWLPDASEHLNAQLAALSQARATARQIVRIAPSRRHLRPAVTAADQRAAQLTLLCGTVLALARSTIAARGNGEHLPPLAHAAIQHLSSALASLDQPHADGPTAAAHAQDAITDLPAPPDNHACLVIAAAQECARDLRRLAQELTSQSTGDR
ncbi:MAG: FUSC family protein [Pseudonocardiaceae bacterium]